MADRPPEGGAAAIAPLERCLTVAPTDVQLIADLGAAYEAGNRAADAEATYQRALSLDPEFADVHARLAALLLARGETQGARAHADSALRLQPNRRALLDLVARTSQGATARR